MLRSSSSHTNTHKHTHKQGAHPGPTHLGPPTGASIVQGQHGGRMRSRASIASTAAAAAAAAKIISIFNLVHSS